MCRRLDGLAGYLLWRDLEIRDERSLARLSRSVRAQARPNGNRPIEEKAMKKIEKYTESLAITFSSPHRWTSLDPMMIEEASQVLSACGGDVEEFGCYE